MIDSHGFRPGVGIALTNNDGKIFWGKRIKKDWWQLPQGGMLLTESPQEAMLRELYEEVGLLQHQVKILGRTKEWLHYTIPRHANYQRNGYPYVGQKQVWFVLRILCEDDQIALDRTDVPEFDYWCWADYWHPCTQAVSFKHDVYRRALQELEPMLN